MINLNRDDRQYLAVEKFEDYELTYCMAYEMAIRNDEVVKTIHSFYKNYVNDDMYTCGYVFSTDDFKKCRGDANKLMDFFINPLSLYISYPFFHKIHTHIKEVVEAHKNDSREEINNIDSYPHLIKSLLFCPFEKEPNVDYKNNIPNEKIVEQKFTKRYVSFVSHLLDEDNKTMTIHHNSITPTYSRPLTPPSKEIKEKDIVLNLALPTKELTSFIEKLKEDYDLKNDLFLTINEFHQQEKIINHKVDKADNRLSNQMKLADMFYIYDSLKLGRKKSDIQTDITVHYRNKGIKTRQFHIDTLNTYQSIMIEYIDDFKYKELVLGKKV
jgi:hypothetical protein